MAESEKRDPVGVVRDSHGRTVGRVTVEKTRRPDGGQDVVVHVWPLDVKIPRPQQ